MADQLFPDGAMADDYGLFSQASSSANPGGFVHHTGMANIDLNAQADAFPAMGSYTDLLQQPTTNVDVLLPHGRGRGTVRGLFQAPRTAGPAGRESTRKMSSVEALGMFLWIVGAPQSFRQAENRFVRSTKTISRKFDKVLVSVGKLAADVIKPKDPEFKTVHPRLKNPRFSPLFDNFIGAIDGTHIPVVVPSANVVQHTGRHGYTSQNVLAVYDFDMRFTFVVAGWPGSAHDMRVFKSAIEKYTHKFPHPPEGKYYLVDSGYANRQGYLAPYRGTKYHLPEFRQGPRARGKKELFNYAHSSLRNVIERCFGVLKMKWRILLDLPAYPMDKQSKIIMACMALHNFIRDSDMVDSDFELLDRHENLVRGTTRGNTSSSGANICLGDDDANMRQFREWIADGLLNKSTS